MIEILFMVILSMLSLALLGVVVIIGAVTWDTLKDNNKGR